MLTHTGRPPSDFLQFLPWLQNAQVAPKLLDIDIPAYQKICSEVNGVVGAEFLCRFCSTGSMDEFFSFA